MYRLYPAGDAGRSPLQNADQCDLKIKLIALLQLIYHRYAQF